MLKNSRDGYGLLSIALHWINALLIFGLFGLGIYMTDLSYYDPWYHKGPSLHVSLGLLLLALTLLRLSWKWINPVPAELQPEKRTINRLALLTKFLLYLLTFTIIASGYLITTAEGKPASFFGLLSIPPISTFGADAVDLAGEIHELLAWGVVLLASLHAAAALFHHYIFRDSTLVRMLKPVSTKEINQ